MPQPTKALASQRQLLQRENNWRRLAGILSKK